MGSNRAREFTCTTLLTLATGVAVTVAGPAVAAVLDYTNLPGAGISQRSDTDGFGQTFTATDIALIDASIMLAEDATFPYPWVSGFRFEVRAGLPGNFDGSSGNVLFQSVPLDIDDVPTTRTLSGQQVKELKLSDVGFTSLPLVVGQTYTLVVRDPVGGGPAGVSAVGFLNYQPGVYNAGASIGHNRNYANTFWSGPHAFEDLAFRVVMIPEPSGSILCVAAAAAAGLPRRRRR